MKQVIIFIFILTMSNVSFGKVQDPLARNLQKLEKSTANRELYFDEKEELLLSLKNKLINTDSPKGQYNLSKQLLFENSYYNNSSALFYANLCLKIATEIGDQELITEAKLTLADNLRFSGLIHESFEILRSLDPEMMSLNNRRGFHRVYMLVCHSYTNLQNISKYRDEYIERAIRHAEAYLELERGSTPEYMAVLSYKYYLERNFHQALNTVKLLLKSEELSPYLRAEYNYLLGLIYLDTGKNNANEALEAFTTSAILSNELAITKLISFLYVAVLLIDTGHPSMEMAPTYIDIALENALIFGDKYRHDFIKTTYYSMQNINLEKANLEKQYFKYIVIAILIFVSLLAASLAILFANYTALKKNREKLSESNSRLQDSNRIKEACIKFFINRNSDHIEEVGKNKKYLLRILNMGQTTDKIRQEIVAVLDTDEEYSSLLADFDKSILELYPGIVEEINKLLKPDNYYTIDNTSKHKLNTELRIIALVRLGVEDNKQIASFLRITVQSVYNYRSKARGRAIDENTFDDDLAKICMDSD